MDERFSPPTTSWCLERLSSCAAQRADVLELLTPGKVVCDQSLLGPAGQYGFLARASAAAFPAKSCGEIQPPQVPEGLEFNRFVKLRTLAPSEQVWAQSSV